MKRTSFLAYSDFVLRVPGLSIDNLGQVPDSELDLSSFVGQCWQDELIRNALILASPDLHETISHALVSDIDIPAKVCQSFINYYTRFCSRPTPFGLFAGVGSGQIEKTGKIDIELLPNSEGNLQCRLDMEYLCYMVETLSVQKGVREKLKYDYNSSFYTISSYFQFVARSHDKKGKMKYTLEAIVPDGAVLVALDALDQNNSYSSMLNGIVEEYEEESFEDCERFLQEALKVGIVINDLVPNLVGEEYSKVLRYKVIDREMNKAFAPFLVQYDIVSSIQNFEDVEKSLEKVAEIAKQAEYKYSRAHLIQGDFLRNTESNKLPESVSNRVLYGLRILRALTDLESDDPLKEFKTIFRRRYISNTVGLAEMMDQNAGIGLKGPAYQQQADPSDLLDDLSNYGVVSEKGQPASANMLKWHHQDFTPKQKYIEFTRNDIKKFDLTGGDWPEQLHAVVSLAGSVDNPEIIFRAAGEGHAGYILGRFAFLPDKGIRRLFEKTALDEEQMNPDKIYAELVHLPEERTGNVLQRPASYSYEIPYLNSSLKPDSHQICTNSLSVSVVDDKVVLTTGTKKKQVVPCLNNAHNYESKQLPMYEFLVKCGKQQRQRAFRLDRIEKFHGEFIPGVRFENMIFRLPSWRLPLGSIKEIVKLCEHKEIEEIQKWAESYDMPSQVVMKQGDQDLFVDWNKPVLIRSFWHHAKNLSVATFEEFPYASGSPVKEKSESFANEIVICFHSEEIK